jgi:two-component system, OmpR family, KDP operon response regulator KdpE
MNHKILIVDDEPAIRRAGEAGPHDPRLGLPDQDGLDAIRQVRAGNPLPIVVLSVRNDEPGKVAALDAGADDYMVKPFGVEELLARVRTALRHRLQQQGLGPVFRLHDLGLDFMAHRVTVGGAEAKLSKREFELLRLLAEQRARS